MPDLRLPQELLDHVLDLLCHDKRVLNNCCLVSKSWIPRTRKHLFAHIRFETEADLESWKNTFPDPSTSPARHTKTLRVGCSHLVTAEDADVGGWIRGFSAVVDLEVGGQKKHLDGSEISLVPLYGFSPVIKSLHADFVAIPSSQLFDLILSFPLLEDLSVIDSYGLLDNDVGSGGLPAPVRHSNPPMLTGSLELSLGGVRPMAPRLLSLPGGIHFRKLTLAQFHNNNLPLATGLVEACSHTLKSLKLSCSSRAGAETVSFDLSKVTGLGDVTFQVVSLSVDWLTRTLQTITPEHRELQEIAICLPSYLAVLPLATSVEQVIGEENLREWSGLDHILVQFWESGPVRPKVMRVVSEGGGWQRGDCIRSMLPETTKLLGLVE